jgi:EAL domain-containing protein (putative c-di-GMP-specific phosphodiesterase class I)
VRNLQHDSNDLALCEAIIAMAHKLGIAVIAEGIETGDQESLLKNFGCDYGQGYHYSRPLPVADFEALLEQQKTD